MTIRDTVSASLLFGLLALAACNGRDTSRTSGPEQDQGGTLPQLPPPASDESFDQMKARLEAEKPFYMQRQLALLQSRYDLSDNPGPVRMTRNKPVQHGVRVKLPAGYTWESLSAMTPEQIRAADAFPPGFLPLPHPKQPEGGMVFPRSTINEVLAQTGRDLTRFDIDLDLPEAFLPEFPPAIFLTDRLDLGDVSQGQVLTTQNYYRLFKDKLNPKQLDGLRLLLSPFAQQQFNLIDDRRCAEPEIGLACFDCHINGHSNGAIHLVQDQRPEEQRNRVDTVSLRGLAVQQLFGSQRALMTVEDFTEFEQRTAYFDGDLARAALKGINPLDRGSQVANMAEMQRLLDFPPAPKLDPFGRLNSLATPAERRGEALFRGKARCIECHSGARFIDNSTHDLQLERFFTPRLINDMVANGDGPIKTFTLRGIKESPPYFHDGRLLTLDDTIEFFNLVLQLRLSAQDKSDLLAFLLVL
jgi:cytochrome c peroxidase